MRFLCLFVSFFNFPVFAADSSGETSFDDENEKIYQGSMVADTARLHKLRDSSEKEYFTRYPSSLRNVVAVRSRILSAAEPIVLSSKIMSDFFSSPAKENVEKVIPDVGSSLTLYTTLTWKALLHCYARENAPIKKVLEVGAGFGEKATGFAMVGTDLTIMEPYPHALKKCQEMMQGHSKVLHKDTKVTYSAEGIVGFSKNPLNQEQYDYIHCQNILHVLTPKNALGALKGLVNCLKPGGIIGVGVDSANNPLAKFMRQSYKQCLMFFTSIKRPVKLLRLL